jgi:hypothetical protein
MVRRSRMLETGQKAAGSRTQDATVKLTLVLDLTGGISASAAAVRICPPKRTAAWRVANFEFIPKIRVTRRSRTRKSGSNYREYRVSTTTALGIIEAKQIRTGPREHPSFFTEMAGKICENKAKVYIETLPLRVHWDGRPDPNLLPRNFV